MQRSKSSTMSASKPKGQMCEPSSKPSVTRIPQVRYPPLSKDSKDRPLSSKETEQPPVSAPSAFSKEERKKSSSKQGVSKRDDTNTRLATDTVKYPKTKYPPPSQNGKRELSSVKDSKHPPITAAGPSLETQNRDNQGISKLNPLKTFPITYDPKLLKGQGKARGQSKSKPVAKLNAFQIEKNNEGSSTRPSNKAGNDEHGIQSAGDSTTLLNDQGMKQDSGKAPRNCDKSKSSHSQSEHKDNIVDTSEMDALITEMVHNQIIRNSDNPKRDIKNFFDKEVKMEKKDIDRALEHFRWLREKIVGQLNSEMNLGTWTFCNAGSHFDGTKVARPNEFDCTMYPVLQTKLVAEFDDASKPGSCKVKVVGDVGDHEKDLKLFLDGSYVNSGKFKAHVFEKLERVIQTDRKLKDARKFATTQSFAVRYEGIPTNEGMKSIDIDFVPSLNIKPWPTRNISRDIKTVIPDHGKAAAAQSKGFNVTAKRWHDAKDPDLLWQVSFSYAEKTITKYADKVSWKPILRTLKRVLEIAKGNSDSCAKSNSPELLQIQKAVRYVQEQKPELRSSLLTTYHIRTLMWWQLYGLTVGEHVWGTETMATRFQESLRNFQKMMTGEMVVPHFFLPQIKDILPHQLGEERAFLYVIARATEVIFSKKK